MSHNASWEDSPEHYDTLRRSWLTERKDRLVIEYLSKLPHGARVLEIGSGTGSSLVGLAKHFPAFSFTGLEPIPGYVEFSEQMSEREAVKNIAWVCGTTEGASEHFSGTRFDFILGTDVLHHVADYARTAAEITAVSRSKASWLIIEPNWKNPYIFRYQQWTAGEKNFWPSEFLPAAERNGWQIQEKRYFTLIPSTIRDPGHGLKRLEALCEGVPVLGGRLLLNLRAPESEHQK